MRGSIGGFDLTPGDHGDDADCRLHGGILSGPRPHDSAHAQGVVNYPPADGMMYALPPQYAAPGGLGVGYTETPPALSPGTTAPNAYAAQPAAPYTYQPGSRRRARLRAGRAAQQYTRGYSQPPAPTPPPCRRGSSTGPGRSWLPRTRPTHGIRAMAAAMAVVLTARASTAGITKASPWAINRVAAAILKDRTDNRSRGQHPAEDAVQLRGKSIGHGSNAR